jgi:hypothetical protein
MAWNFGAVTTTIMDNTFVDVDNPIFEFAEPVGIVIEEDNVFE